MNDPNFRGKLLERVQAEYGGKFEVHLYVGGLQPKYADNIKRFLEEEGIKLTTIDEVIEKLLETKEAYSKDPAVQLLVYLKRGSVLR